MLHDHRDLNIDRQHAEDVAMLGMVVGRVSRLFNAGLINGVWAEGEIETLKEDNKKLESINDALSRELDRLHEELATVRANRDALYETVRQLNERITKLTPPPL